MAHFFGAVSEMRTSGLIPSWLGSSTSQPGGDREREKKKRHLRRGGLWSCSACCAHTQQVMYSGYDELTLSWLLHEIYPPCVPPDLENACLGAKAPREMPGGPSITECLWASGPDFYSMYETLTWGYVHTDNGGLDLLQGDQNTRVGLLNVGLVRLWAQHGVNHKVVGIVYELDLNRTDLRMSKFTMRKKRSECLTRRSKYLQRHSSLINFLYFFLFKQQVETPGRH